MNTCRPTNNCIRHLECALPKLQFGCWMPNSIHGKVSCIHITILKGSCSLTHSKQKRCYVPCWHCWVRTLSSSSFSETQGQRVSQCQMNEEPWKMRPLRGGVGSLPTSPCYFHALEIWTNIRKQAPPAIGLQVAGCIWYLLTVQRVESCIYEQCESMANCSFVNMGCPISVSYGPQPPVAWPQGPSIIHSTCSISTAVRSNANYSFGIYSLGVPLVTDTNPVNKIALPLFWGIMTMR